MQKKKKGNFWKCCKLGIFNKFRKISTGKRSYRDFKMPLDQMTMPSDSINCWKCPHRRTLSLSHPYISASGSQPSVFKLIKNALHLWTCIWISTIALSLPSPYHSHQHTQYFKQLPFCVYQGQTVCLINLWSQNPRHTALPINPEELTYLGVIRIVVRVTNTPKAQAPGPSPGSETVLIAL